MVQHSNLWQCQTKTCQDVPGCDWSNTVDGETSTSTLAADETRHLCTKFWTN